MCGLDRRNIGPFCANKFRCDRFVVEPKKMRSRLEMGLHGGIRRLKIRVPGCFGLLCQNLLQLRDG